MKLIFHWVGLIVMEVVSLSVEGIQHFTHLLITLDDLDNENAVMFELRVAVDG